VSKASRTIVHLVSLGNDPMRVFIASFLLLILAGAGALYLPTSTVSRDNITVIDSLFTSTSAACVTGLTIKDTGRDFTFMGQFIILVLIQLGGLGIVMFGAVFAMLFGQAFSVRESVAMQDLLSASTLNRIPHLIAFIFTVTIAIEALGAVCLMGLWGKDPSWAGSETQRWFLSFFHSVSAFCNAGFGLFTNNLVSYARRWEVYAVICPLIVLGGLGFGVLYNLGAVVADRIKRAFKWVCFRQCRFMMEPTMRFSLQAKVALTVSGILILAGTIGLLVFERYATTAGASVAGNVPDAFFQSVTARTAGFNTINIGALTESSKFVMILLMFIGGSPGGTAGGVKTVTMAVVVMAVISTLYQRGEIQMFHRSIRQAFVSRSLAVITICGAVLFVGVLGLTITERRSDTAFLDLMFEATSALGTVGLSTGITASLTTSGKLILIVLMLVGRLGPLSLAAALTFDTRQPRYTYPPEGIVVG
jgi:trk system potassium uptake protein TrkH